MQSGLAAPQGMPPPPMNPPNFSGSPMLQQSAVAPQQQPQQSAFMGQDQRAQAESYAILQKAQRDQAAWKEFQSKEAPIMDSLAKELRVGPPRYPEQQRLEKPPNPDDFKKYAVEFASAFAVLGALAGKFTRAGGTGALDAFAGAVKGYEQGNLQAYKQKSDEWEQKTQQTLLNNKMVLDKWKAVVENRRMSLADKELSLKMLSTQYQQNTEYNALEAGNFGLAMKAYDMNVAAHDKAVEAFLKVRGNKAHADDEMRGKAQFLESPQGQQFIQQQTPEQQVILQGVIKTYGTGGTMEQNPPQLVGTGRSSPQVIFSNKWQNEHPGATAEEYATAMDNFIAAQSGSRAIGVRAGNIGVSVQEVNKVIPLAEKASAEVPRGEWVPLNQLKQSGQRSLSNPALKRLDIATTGVMTAYASTMSRSGITTVEAQKRASDLLKSADSQESYNAALKQLQMESDAIEEAPQAAKEALLRKFFPNANIQAPRGKSAIGAPKGADGWGLEVQVQ